MRSDAFVTIFRRYVKSTFSKHVIHSHGHTCGPFISVIGSSWFFLAIVLLSASLRSVHQLQHMDTRTRHERTTTLTLPPHRMCFPPSCSMKAVSPLDVTESVTTVVLGCCLSTTAAISAMKRLELISRPLPSTIAELELEIGEGKGGGWVWTFDDMTAAFDNR